MAAHGATYIERFVEGCGPLPSELQRLLSTLRELDERMMELRSTAQSKYEECMQVPGLAGREPSPEQAAHVSKLRAEVEETHKLLQQLSTEKVRLAATAGDLVSGYIRTLDKDLAAFADELLAQAREAEAAALAAQAQRYELGPPGGMGGAAAYGMPHPHIHAHAPPHAYNARRGAVYPPDLGELHAQPHLQQQQAQQQAQQQHHAQLLQQQAQLQQQQQQQQAYRPPRASDNATHWQQRRRQLGPGDQVAANTAENGENWIITTFIAISQAGGLYEVKDEEAEPGSANRYFLEAHNVLPLPRSSSVRDERALPQGTPVLGVFPGTTTFYRATVLAPARRLATGEFDAYLLQFEDDEVEGGGLGRPVDFRHVVPVPQGG